MDYIKIEFFTSAGCKRCAKSKLLLAELINELDQKRFHYREVDLVDEVDYAVDLGVVNTSAIAIDGELVFAAMPSIRKLRKTLESRLARLEGL